MTGKISNEARLKHIIDAINDIEDFTSEISYSEFINNKLVKNATVRQLEIIGEASNNITNEIIIKYSEIDWRQIINFRNIIIHEYFIVDYETVWEIIKDDLPPFKQSVIKILKEEFNN